MTSYHEYNKIEKAYKLVEKLQEGKNIALITDAGTPGISDPGEELVRICYETGIEVTSLPGPAACITALTMSGLPTRRFAFEAFLPRDKKERARVLEELAQESRTMIVYEAPHHLLKTLKELYEVLGNRELTVCKELTKRYENATKTTFDDVIKFYEDNEPKGEYVLAREAWESLSVEEHMAHYEASGMERKEAMKQVAKDRGISKRDVYQALLK